MNANDKKKVLEMYGRLSVEVKERNPDLDWNLDRFDVPFEELRNSKMSPVDAWIYATFFIKPNVDYTEDSRGGSWTIVNSVRKTHEIKKGICNDRAVAILGLIDPKYKPQLVYVSGEFPGHSMTVYQEEGKFGSLSASVMDKTGRRDPNYNSLVGMLKTYPWSRFGIVDWKSKFPDFMDRDREMYFEFKSDFYVNRENLPISAVQF
ncbi:MAG: hypothetical protein Q7S74_04570 [Nanoarchaeota archaeon]|nr:hypothetical protein [Nanoarchaeota archaeon]